MKREQKQKNEPPTSVGTRRSWNLCRLGSTREDKEGKKIEGEGGEAKTRKKGDWETIKFESRSFVLYYPHTSSSPLPIVPPLRAHATCPTIFIESQLAILDICCVECWKREFVDVVAPSKQTIKRRGCEREMSTIKPCLIGLNASPVAISNFALVHLGISQMKLRICPLSP